MPLGPYISEPIVLQGPLGACLVRPREQPSHDDEDRDHMGYGFHAKSIPRELSF